MKNTSLRNAALLALVLSIVFLSFWEYHLRAQGLGISYDDGPELWSAKRSEVYLPADKATVFIGSSRHKFDIDIDTWQSLTGEKAVQLAFEGTSPMLALDDLANDTLFKGKLIFDVTEGLLFSTSPYNMQRLEKAIAYRKKVTPAQRFGFQINRLLESQFVFLDRDYYSLNAILQRTNIPLRKGLMSDPYFPVDFGRISFDRQNRMTDRFVTDTTLQNQVKDIWAMFGKIAAQSPPETQKAIDSIFTIIKTDVAKITSRGGKVLFVRSPSSGPFLQGERMVFPREKLWNRILFTTGSPGIHFEDHPSLTGFQCPEFSHLKPSDAIVYTKNLIAVIEQEKIMTFPNKPASK